MSLRPSHHYLHHCVPAQNAYPYPSTAGDTLPRPVEPSLVFIVRVRSTCQWYTITQIQYTSIVYGGQVLGGLGADGLETMDGWEARRVGVGRRSASMPCQLVVGSWRLAHVVSGGQRPRPRPLPTLRLQRRGRLDSRSCESEVGAAS